MFEHPNVTNRRIATVAVAAFTVIEMVVVVGVIALLAGLMLGAMPALTEKKIHARINTELAGLQTAIDGYKASKGYFPPDNPDDVAQPPLFYELTGTVITNSGYRSIFDPDPSKDLSSPQISLVFNTSGFLNSDSDKKQVKNFYPTLRSSAIISKGAMKLLGVPYRGPQGDFNPWRYNCSHPTNNVGEYDLWAEIVIRGKRQIISNWKQ
jgi:type II secretory pathway pseudopilin PulG